MSSDDAPIVSSVGNPNGHVEWPTSPGLPPVGELVQITTADGWTAVGCRTGELPWVHAVGRPPVACSSIMSWCRVLVLPDDGSTIDLIGSRIASIDGYTPEQWASFRANNPAFLKSRPAYKAAEAVLSALREAAIR